MGPVDNMALLGVANIIEKIKHFIVVAKVIPLGYIGIMGPKIAAD